MIRICIDPGHGGNDSGAIGHGIKEKEYNLLIAGEVMKDLNKYNCEVITTRNSDKYVSLDDRCKYSNSKNAACFISIHCNSYSSSSANGFETFSYDGTSSLQKSVHSELRTNIPLTDRGRKKGNFAVLRNTKAKAVLIECAFLSNSKDSEYLKKNVKTFAKAIAIGIVKHYNLKGDSHVHCECITNK